MGGGGGGQQASIMRDPAVLGLLQQGLASGSFAPQQDFNLHETTMDQPTQAAVNFGQNINTNPLYLNAIGAAQGLSNPGAISAMYQPANSIYSGVAGAPSVNSSPGGQQLSNVASGAAMPGVMAGLGALQQGTGQTDLATGGLLSGPAGTIDTLAAGGNMPGQAGDTLAGMISSGSLPGAAGDYLRNLTQGGNIPGEAGDFLANLIASGQPGGPGGDMLAGLASGGTLPGAAGDYLTKASQGGFLTQQNPFFSQMLETSLNQANPGIMSQFAAGGRGGSGVAANAIADADKQIAGQLGYQDYSTERQLQQGAAGLLGGMQTGAAQALTGQQLNAAQGVTGQQLAAAQQLAGLQNQDTSQLVALQNTDAQQLAALQAAAIQNQTAQQAGQYSQELGFQNQDAQQLVNNLLQQYGMQNQAASGMSQNVANTIIGMLNSGQLDESLLNDQLAGLLSSSALEQNFQQGLLQDTANQQNYDASRQGQGLLTFMQLLSGANTGQQVQNTGGSGALQTIGGGVGIAASLAAIGAAI